MESRERGHRVAVSDPAAARVRQARRPHDELQVVCDGAHGRVYGVSHRLRDRRDGSVVLLLGVRAAPDRDRRPRRQAHAGGSGMNIVSDEAFKWFLTALTGGLAGSWLVYDAFNLWRTPAADRGDPVLGGQPFGQFVWMVVGRIGGVCRPRVPTP